MTEPQLNIAKVLEMPIAERFGGIDVIVKTCKKKWGEEGKVVQQAIVTDSSGDALADINLGKYIYLRGATLRIIVGIVQIGVLESGKASSKKLLIDEWSVQSDVGEPAQDHRNLEAEGTDWDKIARSKVKCKLIEAGIRAGQIIIASEGKANYDRINVYKDFIMEG